MLLLPTSEIHLTNIAVFGVFVVGTMALVIRAGRNEPRRPPTSTPADGRSPDRRTASRSPATTSSAASFLGIAGAIAVYGYDGFLYSIGFLVAWLVALLLVAELLRNTGEFTMADVLSFRLHQRPVRMAAALVDPRRSRCSTCWPRWPAPADLSRCCSTSRRQVPASRLVVAVVGVLMLIYVLVGGMKGTTWVQMVKAVLLLVGAAVMTCIVRARTSRLNFSDLLACQAVV